MEIKECDELGLAFPVVKKDNKPTFIDFLRFIKYKIYLCFPVRKKELYEYLYSMSILVKAIKELEAINRTQITGLLYKVNNMKNEDEEAKSDEKEGNNYRGQYQ